MAPLAPADVQVDHEHEWRLAYVDFEEHGSVSTFDCAACSAFRVE